MANIVEIDSDGLVHDEWCIRTCTDATDICTCSLFGYPHPITEPIADQPPEEHVSARAMRIASETPAPG